MSRVMPFVAMACVVAVVAVLATADVVAASAPCVEVVYEQDFDELESGLLIGQDPTWEPFLLDPKKGFAEVTATRSESPPHSLRIVGADDMVNRYHVTETGVYELSFDQFIPSDYAGDQFFILLNTYDPSGANSWSTQVHFRSTDDLVIADFDGETVPLARDEWVHVRVVIDLEDDRQSFFYGGALLFEDSWTERLFSGGVLEIGAANIFANESTPVYYDNVRLCRIASCVGDVDGDGGVDFADLLALLAVWGPGGGGGPADFNEDGTVDTGDLIALLAAWGSCR